MIVIVLAIDAAILGLKEAEAIAPATDRATGDAAFRR
jgi:hypothetical protein